MEATSESEVATAEDATPEVATPEEAARRADSLRFWMRATSKPRNVEIRMKEQCVEQFRFLFF